jgi:hypothetical protein
VVRDLRDLLAIDPSLSARKVEVVGVRLLREDREVGDGDYRHEMAVALRLLGKKWPKGHFRVQAYDSEGVLIATDDYLEPKKSLDPVVRHLEASFYCGVLTSADLIFEPKNGETAEPWDELSVHRDLSAEEKFSVELRSVRARAHPDFQYSNLITVEITGEVRPALGLPFPKGLAAQVTVYGDDEVFLNSSQVDLNFGPDSVRPIHLTINVYSHEEPTSVRLEFFKQ